MSDFDSNLQQLNDALLLEIVKAMALPQTNSAMAIISLLFGKATLRFSKLVLGLDREVEQHGAMEGARWLLQHFVKSHEVNGMELIPRNVPLIIVSNHPASYDGMVITAHIPRPDLKIIIGEIPPYRYLPHVSQHIIFSPNVKNTFGRMGTVRNAIHHLKGGGALLIFPRGGIEPDPAFMPQPDVEFHQWSRSLEILVRNVPQTQVLITIVSGVIAQEAMHHPITWFRKARPDRQRLAFIYQMIRQVWSGKELYDLIPRVTFGEVLSSANHETILPEVEQAARRVLAQHLLSL